MRGHVKVVAGNIFVFLLILVAIEGLASYVLFFGRIVMLRPRPERLYTRYDADLGWVNKSNVHITDLYGPGVDFRTNSQGFRNNYDFDTVVSNGKSRVICSGDSFALGFGVDNDHTWCQLLTSLGPRLETVNMGQAGYGVDQAYLWYKRDASRLDHQVHLFTFITNDFYRMQSDKFIGYPKPVLKIDEDMLQVRNVPVPRLRYKIPWRLAEASWYFRRLRIVMLFRSLQRKLGFEDTDAIASSAREKEEKTQKVLRKVFEDLKQLNEERSSKLVLVYLPNRPDLKGKGPQEWTEFLERESRALGIPLINILSQFRSLPYEDVLKMYIPKGQIRVPGADHHLNEYGNEVVASIIFENLKNHPEISQHLSID
jgi:hypothetical protein